MNKLFTILTCCAFLFLSLEVYAQEPAAEEPEEEKIATLNNENKRKHNFKLNLISALNKSLTLSYENALSANKSVQLGFHYSKNNFLGTADRLSITPEFRFYVSAQENPIVGLYLAPYLRYQVLTDREEQANDATATATIHTMGGGIAIGKQWIAKKGFTVDLYIGGGYNALIDTKEIELSDATATYSRNTNRWRLDTKIGLSIGYAF